MKCVYDVCYVKREPVWQGLKTLPSRVPFTFSAYVSSSLKFGAAKSEILEDKILTGVNRRGWFRVFNAVASVVECAGDNIKPILGGKRICKMK